MVDRDPRKCCDLANELEDNEMKIFYLTTILQKKTLYRINVTLNKLQIGLETITYVL